MRRRTFLKLTGAAAFPFLACEAGTGPLLRRGREDAAVGDAVEPAEADAGAPPTRAIHESFGVVLNDTSCSGHSHWLMVEAGDYLEGEPVHFLGGSHEIVFHPRELELLEEGMKIPFATIGDGPGHGHCGMAWRESVGPPDPTMPTTCEPLGTALCTR